MDLVGCTLGKFKVVKKLGRGSMSVCYRAVNTVLGSTVALKVLIPSLRHDPLAVSLFQEKAQAMASLDHPGIAMVHDLVQEKDTLFVVMEYVEGRKLNEIVDTGMTPPPGEALRVLVKIADALAYAHEHGVIHHNLKPHNIIIEPSGNPVIIDFGMIVSDITDRLPGQDGFTGRERFKSPEEILRKEVDFRTDLWGLGVTGYCFLTGHFPFQGDTPEGIKRAILSGERPARLSALRPGIPASADMLFEKLLASSPRERPSSARFVRDELARIVRWFPDPESETVSMDDTELSDLDAPVLHVSRPREIGRYRILERKGAGSFAIVYMAEDVELGRIVALKLLKPEFEESEDVIERFEQEAEVIRRIRHPNVVDFYEFGVEELDSSRRNLYFTMEYIEGPSLKDLITPGRPLSTRRAVDIAYQAALGLQAVHRAGVIHRDLKPANILLDKHGRALITDFGIAVARFGEHRLTATGQLLGTYTYMSPEQARGEELTPASDLYSLGVILYEMLTGRVPFADNAPLVILKRIVEEDTPAFPPSLDVPEYLKDLTFQLLKKSPAERFQSAEKVAHSLLALLPQKEKSGYLP